KYDIKGEGGTDYVAVEAATGRVFVSRGTHMMVIEGSTGKVLGDIPNTPGVHGAGIATKAGHGFTTNGGDSTVTMFDLKTLAVIKQIKVETGGLDGIMYDEPDDKIILTNHSRPIGTLTAIDPTSGDTRNSPWSFAAAGFGDDVHRASGAASELGAECVFENRHFADRCDREIAENRLTGPAIVSRRAVDFKRRLAATGSVRGEQVLVYERVALG